LEQRTEIIIDESLDRVQTKHRENAHEALLKELATLVVHPGNANIQTRLSCSQWDEHARGAVRHAREILGKWNSAGRLRARGVIHDIQLHIRWLNYDDLEIIEGERRSLTSCSTLGPVLRSGPITSANGF
jgi:hypothetical protein